MNPRSQSPVWWPWELSPEVLSQESVLQTTLETANLASQDLL